MKRFRLNIICIDDTSKEWLYSDLNQLLLDLVYDLSLYVDKARLISVRIIYE